METVMTEENLRLEHAAQNRLDVYRDRVVELYAQLGSKDRTAKALGISPLTIWRWERQDPEFSRELREALKNSPHLDALEQELDRRAMGWTETDKDGVEHFKYSDLAMFFRVKKIDSSYRDNQTTQVTIDQSSKVLQIYLPKTQDHPELDNAIEAEIIHTEE